MEQTFVSSGCDLVCCVLLGCTCDGLYFKLALVEAEDICICRVIVGISVENYEFGSQNRSVCD